MKKPLYRAAFCAALLIVVAWFVAASLRSASAAADKKGAARADKPQRFGSVIELRPEKKDYYVRLHADCWPSVLEQIRESNIRNYSIYLGELGGKLYLFSYFEYVGSDFEADMKKMSDDPETRRWWKETDPCQQRIPGTAEGQQWMRLPEVFHTD
jgi:L-rhamnose mutarotase